MSDHGPVPSMDDLEGQRYTMTQLQEETGLSPRTIRYYITQGLLSPAHGRGPSATYDDGHLLRLLAINEFKKRMLPLETIKNRLGNMSDADIESSLRLTSTDDIELWRRYELHPDIQLHVRTRANQPRDRLFDVVIQEIIGHARVVIASRGETGP